MKLESLLRVKVSDPTYAARFGIVNPKFSDRLQRFEKELKEQGTDTNYKTTARYAAVREHLVNLHRVRKTLTSQQKAALTYYLRSLSSQKHKGEFTNPYALD